MHSDVIIIGSGPAGYSAAIYTARAALKTTVIAGYQAGGQLTITTDVENYPGFAEVIQGPWLMEQMRLQAVHVGCTIINQQVARVDFSKRLFVAYDDLGNEYTSNAIIIATGAQAKWLGIDSEEKFKGFGVSGCATCDGFFYRNKRVLVVGGGNSAVEESLYLTNHASEVILVHRRDKLRAEQVMQQRLFAHPKIKVIWDSEIVEIKGTEDPLSVNGVKISNVKTGEISELTVDGVFIAIGHSPSTAIFKDQLDIDDEGYIITQKGSTFTSVPGVFAAGDVQDKVYRQAVTAAGTGCMAALDAIKYLQNN